MLEINVSQHYQKFLDERTPSMSGILDGTCKGKVWYFPEEEPKLAVVYSYCVGGCAIFGEIPKYEDVKVNEFFDKVFCELKEMGMDAFEFTADNPILYEQVKHLFEEKEIYSEQEYSYRKIDYIEEVEISDEYQFVKVDKNLLQKLKENEYTNGSTLLEWIDNSWKDADKFLEVSRACIAIYEKKVVGMIFGSAKFQQYIVVDIEVDEAHRRKGIGRRLTQEFVNDCIDDQMVVQWDCVESNIASQRLAKVSGFHKFHERTVYWFDTNI